MAQNNNFGKKHEHWERMTKKSRNVFAIMPIIPNILIIAIAFGVFYYCTVNSYFPDWITYIYWAMKIIIGFEILAASARSLWAPLLGLASGVALLFTIQVYDISLVTTADAWQIIGASLIGFLITIAIKL